MQIKSFKEILNNNLRLIQHPAVRSYAIYIEDKLWYWIDETGEEQFPPTLCITEALELWLKCNNFHS